jgi:hypothetical protein
VTEVQFQFLTVTLLFVCFSFEETEERASCTRVEEASDMQARRNDAVWGPLSPQKPKNGTVLGTSFPQMPKHGTVLGIFISSQKPNTAAFWPFLFPPKSPHNAVLAIFISPQKPTRRRFGDQLSHQIAHVGPAFFLSFLVWFLSSFLFGLV